MCCEQAFSYMYAGLTEAGDCVAFPMCFLSGMA